MDELVYTSIVFEIYNNEDVVKLRKIKSELQSLLSCLDHKLTKIEQQPSPNQIPLL